MYRQSTSKNWAFKVSFEVLLDLKQVHLLHALQNFWGVGTVYLGKTTATFRVTSLAELSKIITHFTNFPLLSPKSITFTYWAQVVKLMLAKEHLTSTQTFHWIMSVYAALGRGASVAVTQSFPSLVPLNLPAYTVPVVSEALNPWWLSGYMTLYCSFYLNLETVGWKLALYHKYRHRFTISFSPLWGGLATVISQYLCLPLYTRADGRVDVTARTYDEALALIEFLDGYPLQSSKYRQYEIWRGCVLQLSADKSTPLPEGVLVEQFYSSVKELYELKRTDAYNDQE